MKHKINDTVEIIESKNSLDHRFKAGEMVIIATVMELHGNVGYRAIGPDDWWWILNEDCKAIRKKK